ncbi:hypothetical protein C9I57_22455 [Trinickia symbiotica]|uniref:Cell wall anchor protein n=1 Tax=Trinickia symbiotica TaxID=863227 RepID=A0A2T3XPK3_9BURK|nr:hypothetical protein [Trinickia symbiotica]PTB18372.1 hypothetical protein C9I57_22455 [Trinickia symbiotica]
MKTNLKRIFVAAALFAVASGSAFAHSGHHAYLFNATVVDEHVGIEGNVLLFGCASVSGTVGAVVNNAQHVAPHVVLDALPSTYLKGSVTTTVENDYRSVGGSGFATSSTSSSGSGTHRVSDTDSDTTWFSAWSDNAGSGGQSLGEHKTSTHEWNSKSEQTHHASWAFSSTEYSTNVSTSGSVTTYIDTQAPTTLTATTGSGAGNGISGNVGINVTEGIANAQSNDASLASVDTGNVFGNAQIFSSQSSGGNVKINNFVLNASIGDNSLQHISGNVGVNVSSGAANVQNNSLAAATTQSNPGDAVAVAMAATDQTSQTASLDFHGSIAGTALLGAGALAGSTGNIGVNIAGGAGNLQHNGLAIAAAGAH